MNKDFKQFFQSLEDKDQIKFAKQAKTSVGYIRTHLIYGRKIPKPKLFNRLVAACNSFGSGITRNELFEFFYSEEKQAA